MALVERHQAEVWRYLRYLGADASTADDLTQETFLELVRRPPEPRGDRATARWLRTVARHLLLKLRQRADRLPAHLELEAAEAVWAEHSLSDYGDSWRRALQGCVRRLPPRSREIIAMRYERGLGRDAIGRQLGLGASGGQEPAATVAPRPSRMRAATTRRRGRIGMTDSREHWQGRWVDRGLEEIVGGEQPPDLRDAFRARLRQHGIDPAAPTGTTRRNRGAWVAVAVAALLTVAVALRWCLADPPRRAPVAVVAQLVAGDLIKTHGSDGTREPWHVPQARTLSIDDSLTARSTGAVLRIETMGTLTFRPRSRIEIRDMTLTRTQDRLIVASIAAVVTAGTVGWASGAFQQTATIGDTVRLERNDLLPEGMTRMDVAALQREVEQLRAEAQQRVDRTEESAPPVADTHAAEAAAEDPVAEGVAALFEDPELAEVLGDIDWASAGATIEELMPIMEKLRAALAAGEEMPMDVIGELSKLNGELIGIASKLVDAGVPGAGVNGSFTPPIRRRQHAGSHPRRRRARPVRGSVREDGGRAAALPRRRQGPSRSGDGTRVCTRGRDRGGRDEGPHVRRNVRAAQSGAA